MALGKNSNVDPVVTSGARADVDQGLRTHMVNVYNTMSAGLVVTAFVAYAVANIPVLTNLVLGTPLFWVAAFAPLAFIWFGFSPARMHRYSAAKVQTMFYIFAAVFGLSLSSIFVAFTEASIVRVFFITSAMFLGMSLWGYTTKKDLTAMGSFLMMGLIGIIIASLVNLFFQSDLVHWVTSVLGVVIFTGMTAWDTQNIKESYSHAHDGETASKLATMGALSLYMNFVLLFQNLMHLMGNRE